MTSTTVKWTPITERFGAEVDIDLNEDLTGSVTNELSKLMDERHVLLFRNQEIDFDTQWATISVFGNPLQSIKYISTNHDYDGNLLDEQANADPIANTENFHSDLVFLPAVPIRGISLYGEDVSGNKSPAFQGTRFVSARDAYLQLPESARAELAGRTAIHVHEPTLKVDDHLRFKELPVSEVQSRVTFWAEHPIFFPSPRTGEPILLYNPWFTHSIVGMTREESAEWFAQFDQLMYCDENTYTHHWEHNDLVVWDNIALQHAKTLVEHVPGHVPTRVLRRVSFGIEDTTLSDFMSKNTDVMSPLRAQEAEARRM